MEIEGKRVGLLVFKSSLQIINTKNGYIELKSFFLFDDFGKWNIWHLWDIFLQEIEKNFSQLDGIYVTISKEKARISYELFQKLWFQELYSVYDEYFPENQESHLFYDNAEFLKPQTRDLTIKRQYLEAILSNQKTVEWRTWRSFYKYKTWDIINFLNAHSRISKQITWVVLYKDIKTFLENEWLEKCLPGVKTIQEWIKIYHSLPWYEEKIKKFWIIAFRF